MAPPHARQLLIWTLPTIAVLFSFLWYKRKRLGSSSDPGDKFETPSSSTKSVCCEIKVEVNEEKSQQLSATPNRTFSRSLSGVDSAPIDIVLPHKLKATKSNPVVISDEDLDLEIEKIKSMRYGGSIDMRKSLNETVVATPSKIVQSSSIKEEPSFTVEAVESASSIMAQQKTEERNMSVDKSTAKETTTAVVVVESPENRKNDAQMQRQNNERDSANHSPVDAIVASPSLSSISDNNSEGSNDSGKGGSDVVTPPPPAEDNTPPVVEPSTSITLYEFLIPQTLVGKLIGKHGSFVQQIKDRAGAHVVVRKFPGNSKSKVCVIEGNQKAINSALKMIREKFPLKRFPEVTLEEFNSIVVPESTTPFFLPDHFYLKLVEGINNDTIVSCMVTPSHLFLQQPTHPSFPNLNLLNNYMNTCYNEMDSPLLPAPAPENTLCVAFSCQSWYRAIILNTDPVKKCSYVKFLDYGGFAYVENAQLRQIRGDFLTLPFQAAECMLADITPVGESWCRDAYDLVAEVTKGAMIFTQIADYTEDGIPLVLCYVILGPQQLVFLNEELVKQGYAKWANSSEEEGAAIEEVTETTETTEAVDSV